MINFSVIQKSQLEGALRLDAEYYQPEYLSTLNKIKTSHFDFISNLLSRVVVTGSTPKKRDCKNDGTDIKFIKTDTLREGQIVFDKADCLPLEESIKNSELKSGDIIVTIIGATHEIVGRVARVFPSDPKMNINQNVALLRPKELSFSSYISVFLQTKYGRDQIWQQSRQTEQVNLNCREVENILVPIPEQSFAKEIDDLVTSSYGLIGESKKIYAQAENVLLEKLGLEDSEKNESLFSVVSLSEVKGANRIDAEYFQVKYEKLVEKIKQNNAKKLGDIVSMKKGIEVGAEEYREEGKIFIRVSSMTKFGIVESDQKYLSDKLYESLKNDFEPKKGEILLTKDATLGIACVLKEDIQGIVSGGNLRLKLKNAEIEAEYLALCLNSIVGQMQAERDAGGSVIAHWKPEQIKNVVIPILPKETQQKIADLVRQSYESRKKAKVLLEEAKSKVEEMIEKASKQ